MKTSPVMIVRIPCPGNTSIKTPDRNNKIPKKFFIIKIKNFSLLEKKYNLIKAKIDGFFFRR